jgi:hypothetical protein
MDRGSAWLLPVLLFLFVASDFIYSDASVSRASLSRAMYASINETIS